jgi:hypothetical protein
MFCHLEKLYEGVITVDCKWVYKNKCGFRGNFENVDSYSLNKWVYKNKWQVT